jgi:hypothetical protein
MQIWLTEAHLPLCYTLLGQSVNHLYQESCWICCKWYQLSDNRHLRQVRLRKTCKRRTYQEVSWGHLDQWKKLLEGENSDMPVLGIMGTDSNAAHKQSL